MTAKISTYQSPTVDVKTVRIGFAQVTDSSKRIGEIEVELNRQLEEAGVHVRAELVPFDHANFFNKPEILKTAIGDFDILAADSFVADFADFVNAGYAKDITDYLGQFPDLLNLVGEGAWAEAALNGRIFWVPLMRSPYASQGGHDLYVSEWILQSLGKVFPRTLEEAESLLLEAKAAGLPHKVSYYTNHPPKALYRGYTEWPFYVDQMSLFIYYADGEMEPYIESDVFSQDIMRLQELAEHDVLFREEIQSSPEISLKDSSFFQEAGIVMSMNSWVFDEANVEYQSGILEPQRPRPRIGSFSSSGVFVTSSCADPETAMEMISAIYLNDMVALTLIGGIEGQDWHMGENSMVEGNIPIFYGRDFYYHYKNLLPHRPSEDLTIGGESGTDYPYSGFRFFDYSWSFPSLPQDMTDALQAVYGLRCGLIPPAELDSVKQQMYDAGLQALYDEHKQLYEEFLAR